MGHLPFEKRNAQILERTQAVPSEKYGKKPEERTIPELLDRGIVVIDKPAGPTSHQVSSYAKNILRLQKAGHSGTLDPGVTGVLPVALANGTRIVQSLLPAGKEYICLMHLHNDVPEEKVKEELEKYVGKIKQLPPIKSAVKRQWRFRKIYYTEFIEMKGRDVLFTIGCQAGTYIRKYCTDFGQRIGVGAHMVELRRTKAAGFSEKDLCTLQELADAFHYYNEGDETQLRKYLLPIERGVTHLSKIWIQDSAVNPICNGIQLKVPGIVKVEAEIQVDDIVAVMTLKNELVMVGVAQMTSKELLGEKGIAVKTQQVLMPPTVYPRMT